MKQLSFQITEEDHKAVKMAAAERGMSIRHFIMVCIKRSLQYERIHKAND